MRRFLRLIRAGRQLTLASLLLLVVINGMAVWLLRDTGLWCRFIPASDVNAVPLRRPHPEVLASFAEQIQGDDPLALMAAVMNRVGRVEAHDSADALRLLQHVDRGGGTLCGGMARLLYHALTARKFPARIVSLVRNLGDSSDTHVVVEVQQNGRWFVLDPTFNVTYERDGRPLGAQELAAAAYDGSISEVSPRFHGEVRYPARLASYYMDWKPLFNNVFIMDTHRSSWGWLPVVRWWHGAVRYYPAGPGSTGHVALVNRINWLVTVALPCVILLLGVATIVAWWPAGASSKRASRPTEAADPHRRLAAA